MDGLSLVLGSLRLDELDALTPAELADLADEAQREPLRWLSWLPGQLAYLQHPSRFRLLRSGNQYGKTTVGLADVVMCATGEHPYRRCDAHGIYWVLCASWSQSIAIQRKLWALLPGRVVKPGTEFNAIRGFRAKNPAVEVRHADGGWSLIVIKTTEQGTLDLASDTIRGALFDEPPKRAEIYSEVVKRVQALSGWIGITMTPIGAPVDWIRDEAASGRLSDIHVRMVPEAMVPVGLDRPLMLPAGDVCDAAWIERITAETPAHEVPVRVHGEWEVRVADRYFATFRSTGLDAHVHARTPPGDLRLYLGVDHGDRPGKQCALLVAVYNEDDERGPSVYVADEYTDASGTATPADDARGILEMLERHGLTWRDLDAAYGDRVHLPGSGRQKSNKDLGAQIARRLKLPADELRPQVRTVKRGEGRGAGSLSVGQRWLYHAITQDRLGISPRCKKLIESLDHYQGIPSDEHDGYKDAVDALRYALDPWIFRSYAARAATGLVVR